MGEKKCIHLVLKYEKNSSKYEIDNDRRGSSGMLKP